MKENEKSPAPRSSDPVVPPDTAPPEIAAAKALEAMLEENSNPASESKSKVVDQILIKHVERITEGLASLRKDIADIHAEMQRIKTDDHVLTEMHDRCRELGEQYHEREVLGPFLLTAIGIADRCRQQTARLRKVLQEHSGARNQAAILAIRQILDARNADQLETESVLINYGVEPYENPDETFDASLQKCVSRVECVSSKLHGRICQRLLPGYRRHGRVLRQEYVSVHICTEDKITLNTGEAS